MSVTIRFRGNIGNHDYDKVVEEGSTWDFNIPSILTIYDQAGIIIASFPSTGEIISVFKGLGPDANNDTRTLFINFILDETGSMFPIRDSTISSFNEYINGLKRQPENRGKEVKFTLTQFNSDKTRIIHNAVKLRNVNKLTRENYSPNYATPLYDAIGDTIQAMEGKVAGSNVLCVIQTDGEENSSREWDRSKIFDLISKKQKEGWTFAFLGANQDAWIAGSNIGIPTLNTLSYTHSSKGMRGAMSSLTSSTIAYASAGGIPTADFFSGKTDIRDEDDKEK